MTWKRGVRSVQSKLLADHACEETELAAEDAEDWLVWPDGRVPVRRHPDTATLRRPAYCACVRLSGAASSHGTEHVGSAALCSIQVIRPIIDRSTRKQLSG